MTRVNVQIQDQVTEAVVETLFDIPAERIRAPEPPNIVRHEGSNNDVAEVRFGNGRALMVKRALHDWSLPRFRAAEAERIYYISTLRTTCFGCGMHVLLATKAHSTAGLNPKLMRFCYGRVTIGRRTMT